MFFSPWALLTSLLMQRLWLWPITSILVLSVQITLFQKFRGLPLCWVAWCKWAALWHWCINDFLLATQPCGPFFFKCLLVSWSYLWVFLRVLNNFFWHLWLKFLLLYLTVAWNPSFFSVWALLSGVLYVFFLFYKVQPSSPADPFLAPTQPLTTSEFIFSEKWP